MPSISTERSPGSKFALALLIGVLLSVPLFAVCRDECKGLCPKCGTDLNVGTCACAPETDSRWDTLRAIRGESE